MGTVSLVNFAAVAVAIPVLAVLRWAFGKVGLGHAAPEADLRAIEAALAPDGGSIVRASLDRPGVIFGPRSEYLDERTGGRLYNVTLRIGSVQVRRRVAVRAGAPALLLP